MWILIKKTYAGSLGLFASGTKQDLPETIVKQLPKNCWEPTQAPWDIKKATSSPEDKQFRPGKKAGKNAKNK